MTVLAYDPALLERLCIHLHATIDELQRTTCTDPLADGALRTVRRAADDLDSNWLPLVRRVLATDPLRERGGALLDVPVLRLDAAGVRALARALDHADVDELVNDTDELRDLATELALIDADPTRRAQFLKGYHDWPQLVNALATRRAYLASSGADRDGPTQAEIDQVLVGFARLIRDDLAALSRLQPYAAALLVRTMDLDPLQLAAVADQLVLRWCDDPWTSESIGSPAEHLQRSAPNPADILFPMLLADATATREYVALAGTHPQTLFLATTQPELAHRLVLAATDPSVVSTADAGRLLAPLLLWFRDGDGGVEGSAVHDAGWSVFLADAIAPWTLQLSAANHDWGLTPDQHVALMEVLTQDDATIRRLIANADAIRDEILTTDHGLRALQQFATYLGTLQQLVVEHRVTDAEGDAAGLATLMSMASLATAFVPGGVGPNLIANGVLVSVQQATQEDIDAVRHDAERTKEAAITIAAASVAAALYRQWIGDMTLPATVPPPPMPDLSGTHPEFVFREAYDTWLQRLPGGYGGPLADRFDRYVGALVNPEGVGESIAQ